MRKRITEKKRDRLLLLLKQNPSDKFGTMSLGDIAKILRIKRSVVQYYQHRQYFTERQKQRRADKAYRTYIRTYQREWCQKNKNKLNKKRRKRRKIIKLLVRATELGLI